MIPDASLILTSLHSNTFTISLELELTKPYCATQHHQYKKREEAIKKQQTKRRPPSVHWKLVKKCCERQDLILRSLNFKTKSGFQVQEEWSSFQPFRTRLGKWRMYANPLRKECSSERPWKKSKLRCAEAILSKQTEIRTNKNHGRIKARSVWYKISVEKVPQSRYHYNEDLV